VQTVRIRSFNHIGPRQRQGFVAADFAAQIAEIESGRRPPQMTVGALDVARDFSDVRDVSRRASRAKSTTSAQVRRSPYAPCWRR
jgi:GDP-4-dehydro-6-deoxy-D-mannose reductase